VLNFTAFRQVEQVVCLNQPYPRQSLPTLMAISKNFVPAVFISQVWGAEYSRDKRHISDAPGREHIIMTTATSPLPIVTRTSSLRTGWPCLRRAWLMMLLLAAGAPR